MIKKVVKTANGFHERYYATVLTQRVRGQAFQFRFNFLNRNFVGNAVNESLFFNGEYLGITLHRTRGVISYLNCLNGESPPGGPPERGTFFSGYRYIKGRRLH